MPVKFPKVSDRAKKYWADMTPLQKAAKLKELHQIRKQKAEARRKKFSENS